MSVRTDRNQYQHLEEGDDDMEECPLGPFGCFYSPCCLRFMGTDADKNGAPPQLANGLAPPVGIVQPIQHGNNQYYLVTLPPADGSGFAPGQGPPMGKVAQVQPMSAQQLAAPIPKQFTTDDPINELSEKLGRIQFSIIYDFDKSTLTLKIIRATNLEAKDIGGTSDPYVKVILLPDKNTKLTTSRKRKNLNPRWNEIFAFEEFPYEKIIATTLFMQVLDYDRFSKDDPIGEILIPMTEFDLVNGQTLWKNLNPSTSKAGRLGELFLILFYDQSTIRITVVKAANLKAKDINGMSDPYVKIWQMTDGKRTEKKRTSIKQKTLNPVFDETFSFDVPTDRIRQTSFLVSVMDFDRCGRNEPIGQIILGSKSAPDQVKHWNEMFSKARQEVGKWHVLRDFE